MACPSIEVTSNLAPLIERLDAAHVFLLAWITRLAAISIAVRSCENHAIAVIVVDHAFASSGRVETSKAHVYLPGTVGYRLVNTFERVAQRNSV